MKTPSDNALSWMVTMFAIWYAGWSAYSLSRRALVYGGLYSGLRAELPLPTRIALASCSPVVLWVVWIAAVVFLLVKEVRIERFRTRVLISVITYMAAGCTSAVIGEVIFQPMLSLINAVR
jgi:hypothetical protein